MPYSLKNIKKTYGPLTVLDIDSLLIEEGPIHAFLGPNGAGKTTLMHILAFLLPPTSGELSFRGEAVRFTESRLKALRQEVVCVFQNPTLFSQSVYKNMEFGLKIRGIPPKKRERIIHKSLDLVDMRPHMRSRAHRLSGGETQRVAIARALAIQPKVILLDEPTASVDARNQAAVIRIIKRINIEENISVLFTSHDALWAKSLARQVVTLSYGSLGPLSMDNVFSGRIENSLLVLEGTLQLQAPTGQSGQVRVSLDPGKIRITDPDHENHLTGQVMQVSRETTGVCVVVDCKLPLSVFMTEAAYKKSPPLVGDRVGLQILPDALAFLNRNKA